MKGAIVFLITFIIFVIITLGYLALPPGRLIYSYVVPYPDISEPILGIPTTNLVISIFNGVVYGVIVWLIYTIAARATRKEKKQSSDKPTQEETKKETS